jgi:hypothetical protein
MRKRPVARPRLEPIEDRLVPSVTSLLDPTAAIRSAIGSLSHAHPAQVAKAHGTRSEAATHPSHPSRAGHHVHHHHPKATTSGNSFSNFFQNFFKSTGL